MAKMFTDVAYRIREILMANSWSRGWELIVHSLKVFQAYPTFLIPIFTVWGVYAPSILYLKYVYPWKLHSFPENLFVVFLYTFLLSFLLLMSCAVVLEMIRQIEIGQPSLGNAIAKAVNKDMLTLLPLAIVWALIWTALTVLEAILSKKKDNEDDETLTAQNAAATIANYHDFTLSAAFIEALQKGIRMVMFLILPAIAWEDMSLLRATHKGLAVLRAHLGEFGSGYALTYAAAGIIFLPPAILLKLGTGRHGGPPLIHFPDSVWVGVIIYIGFAWSFSIYLEQMFMAQLYLWHMKWEAKVAEAKQKSLPLPTFKEVDRPELLAKTPGLFA